MKLLVLSPGTNITSPKSGHQVRVWNLVKQLQDRGWEIEVLQRDSHYTGDMNIRVRSFYHFLPDRLNDLNPFLYSKLFKRVNKFKPDIIHVKSFSGVLASKIVSYFSDRTVDVVYDAHNFETEKIKEDKTHLPWYKQVVADSVVSSFEKVAVHESDHIISVSESDKEKFREAYEISDDKITVVPSGSNLFDLNTSPHKVRERYPDSRLLVFHGSYNYPPNKQAVESIVEFIAPHLNQNDDQFQFIIAGNGVPSFENNDSVQGLGFVDDLEALLICADVAVVPLQEGGGTKLKMFDYMSASLPIVTTETGAEGIELQHEESALIYKSPDEKFINGIVRLLKDRSLQTQLGDGARNIMEEKYTWESIGEQLDSLYRSLLDNS